MDIKKFISAIGVTGCFYVGFAQVYEAGYVCYLNNPASMQRVAADSSEAVFLNESMGARSKFVYRVRASAGAMEIKGYLDSVPSLLPVHSENSLMLVNLASATVYMPEEGFKKIRFLVSDSISSGGDTCYIKGYPRNYYFMVNPKLPACINPGFFVKNGRGAVTALITPVFEMKLEAVKKRKGKLEPSPEFKKPGARGPSAYFSLID